MFMPDPSRNLCFDLDDDPGELHDLAETATERDLVELLRHALDHVDAPAEQLERLGLR
jgi:hypothetical protein